MACWVDYYISKSCWVIICFSWSSVRSIIPLGDKGYIFSVLHLGPYYCLGDKGEQKIVYLIIVYDEAYIWIRIVGFSI